MGDKTCMSFTDGHGREVVREVHLVVNVEDLRGTAMYPWLVVAANPRMSAGDIERFLDLQSIDTPAVFRSLSWIKRRQWMARPPGSYRRNRDGRDEIATRIMAENPCVSIRTLVLKLKERGIKRGREWVRQHRTDGL